MNNLLNNAQFAQMLYSEKKKMNNLLDKLNSYKGKDIRQDIILPIADQAATELLDPYGVGFCFMTKDGDAYKRFPSEGWPKGEWRYWPDGIAELNRKRA